MRNYYQILGITEDTTIEIIKSAFRKLSFIHHPDKNNGSIASEEKFKEILEAYEKVRIDFEAKSNPKKSAQTNQSEKSEPFNQNGESKESNKAKESESNKTNPNETSIGENNLIWWTSLPAEWSYYFIKDLKINGPPDDYDFEQLHSLSTILITLSNSYYPTKITSLSPLRFLKKLKIVDIFYMPITDLSPLENHQDLEIIRITYKANINTLLPLAGFTKLKELEIDTTHIDTLEPIRNNLDLEILTISGDSNSYCPLKSLEPLKLLKLKKLRLNYTLVSDITLLSQFREIELLDISFSKVRDITSLFKLSSLRKLYLINLQIKDNQIEEFKLLNPNCEVILGKE